MRLPLFPRSPVGVTLASYATAAVVGAVLFSLPFATQGPRLAVADALFLSTSAICVTGLSPVASLTQTLTPAGFGVLLVLIQLGGIGLVLLGVSLFRLAGRRLTVRHAEALGEAYADSASVGHIVRRVLLATVAIEAAGALALRAVFRDEARPWWSAVFHSVSAFCNAGFSSFPGGMMSYRTSVAANLVMIVLIILGGIGFRVLAELTHRTRGHVRRLSLHSRIALQTSAFLVVGGAVLFAVLEWNEAALGGLSAGQKLMASVFQSVTTRTAGFNTVDVVSLHSATLLVFCLWMVIGGSPGSTAGGMKTVTLVLVVRAVWAQIRGASSTSIRGRTIPLQQISQAFTVAVLYLTTLMTVVLLLTVLMGNDLFGPRPFLALLFEACSALGTVGLSTGVTPQLPAAGKLLLVATMLVGRVGPLALVYWVPKALVAGKVSYPEEPVGLG